jgi:hypothetical protein
LLVENCLKCHGEAKSKAGLKLTSRASILKGGESGPAAVAGKPEESLLIRAIRYADTPQMPPKGKLTDADIEVLTRWVRIGLPWPESGTSKPLTEEQFWAFRPVQTVTPPVVKDRAWPQSDVDRFILAVLEAQGLTPARPADKLTLIRRATFDLTGMPPTPEEIDAFERDGSPHAFTRVVDRLLASPRYGERWGRHWLDVARFGESQGYERDKIRDHAWRYRDYVVHSFNQDKPYTQFVKEQLAGDVLEPVTQEGIVATGFLVAGPWDEVGATQQGLLMRKRVREEELEDILSAVGQTFLGLTVNCARCHDHKFDPIPQRDYYRLKAVFEGVHHGDRPLLTPAEQKVREERRAGLERRVGQLQKDIAALEQLGRDRIQSERKGPDLTGLPTPMARWTFETDARDTIGTLHGTLRGGAVVAGGRLRLNGEGAFLQTAPLPRDMRAKTLEAWVAPANLTKRGGGVMTVENKDGSVFDAIVFGEREPMKWFAGSDFYHRTRDLDAPPESLESPALVHLAIVYSADHRIGVYRNGVPYGPAYVPTGPKAGLQTYAAHDAHVLFGLRHTGAGNGFFAGDIEEARLYDRALSPEEVAASFRAGASHAKLDEILASLTPKERQRREALAAELSRQRETLQALPPLLLAYAANPSPPELTFVLARGDVEKQRELVSAGGLSAVKVLSPEFGLPADAPEGQRRLKLADWIASADNPLTARVVVNRVWHYHFGHGLVGTPNDFGFNGDSPSHPQLLDWLARRFIADGWSIKQLHRRIMLSSAYQQSSQFDEKAAAMDGENRLLWRFTPRRLEGEAVRDAMLAVSGQINQQMGGPSFRPFTLKVFNSHFYELTDPLGPEYDRRTVYRINVNSAKSPLLDSLDCPDPSVKMPRRSVTTTPLQALGLMHNSFVLRQARQFALRVQKDAETDLDAQVERAYSLAFGRRPTILERDRAATLSQQHGLETLCWVLFNAIEFLYLK